MADAGAVRQFVRFSEAIGLPLQSILDPQLNAIVAAAAQSERVPAHGIVDLLQVSSAVSGRSDLGIAFAAWGNLRGYGPLSLLWDHCPTFKEAIRVNHQYMHLESGALATRSDDFGDEVYLSSVVLVEARFGASQFVEATLALSMLVGRLILGQSWTPVKMEFQHPAPRSLRQHHDLFRCPVEFGAERNALVVSKSDLTRETGAGNAHMLAYLERHLASSSSQWPEGLVHQIERIVSTNLSSGDIALEQVAAALNMNLRTLQRRLSVQGQSYNRIVERVRKRIVQDYVNSDANPNLSELAFRLGYSETSAASRFLSSKMGIRLRG
ncbi:AraC family transcriptional regulator ligand-binding domain-containing protein [Novosphingobium sp. KCTC 2891]|uniref:AraC family transcriptional regulator ligand-binding domain-containing protein n=1 Tax=Novosphingobium sp. KCTC 2891 TaxID=2989730 RepID=UPI002222A712|nr:AraC family transcriptional regulator ligand-binding domain-containing protein [Novosphingobium sp. KCTC 2891]